MPLLGDILNKAKDVIVSKGEDLAHQAVNSVKDGARDKLDKLKEKAKESIENTKKSFTFDELPDTLEELKAWEGFDMSSPFCVAAMTIAALCRYPEKKKDALEMIEFLNGPVDLTEYDRQFLDDRFMDGKWYVPMSYFEGSDPDNNYKAKKPYRITVTETPYSDVEEDDYKIKMLYLSSSGADSMRPLALRQKQSTGEWFLWNLEAVLSDIRIPKEKDPWA